MRLQESGQLSASLNDANADSDSDREAHDDTEESSNNDERLSDKMFEASDSLENTTAKHNDVAIGCNNDLPHSEQRTFSTQNSK